MGKANLIDIIIYKWINYVTATHNVFVCKCMVTTTEWQINVAQKFKWVCNEGNDLLTKNVVTLTRVRYTYWRVGRVYCFWVWWNDILSVESLRSRKSINLNTVRTRIFFFLHISPGNSIKGQNDWHTFTVCSCCDPTYAWSPLRAEIEYAAGPPACTYATNAAKNTNCKLRQRWKRRKQKRDEKTWVSVKYSLLTRNI